MKVCFRCQNVFKDTDHVRCPYCELVLFEGDQEIDIDWLQEGGDKAGAFSGLEDKPVDSLINLVSRNRIIADHGHMRYIIGSYFRNRNFYFLYKFSRSEYKMGKYYRRILTQPLDLSAIFKIPWTIIVFIDSLIIRLFYNGFCEECYWKYIQINADQPHNQAKCEYNKEYYRLVRDILSGKIGLNESFYKHEALRKIRKRESSAYYDLTFKFKKDYFSWFLDLLCIMVSFILIVAPVVWFLYPLIKKWISPYS